jgi:tRNA threonylcarbamoyladenosine biosynthesis protein TsaB
MNRWLAFDTSTDVLSLAVGQGDQTWSQTLPGGAQASASLIPSVLDLLAQAGMPLASLDAIVFGRGPGSFTGLRTACSVAQGLALGAQLPVLPVDTLLAVAEEARLQAGCPDTLTVLALLDARMDEIYSAVYRWASGAWTVLSPLQVCAPERIAVPNDADLLMAGNVFDVYGERLPAGQRLQALPTARALLSLAPALWTNGQAVPAEQAMPLYIRDKVAQTTAEREAHKAQATTQPPAAQA